MSFTVSDLLNLPSLRNAKVVAGRNGLNKIISSVSVLESVNPALLVDGLFRQGEFFGSEIVITGFLNCPNDVDCQYANIKRLAEGGEIGLILYYVGIYMTHVDKRLIDLADSMDFVLIQMPKSKELRYGEVISDITEHLFKEKTKNEFIVSDVLARVSRLPDHQRSINTVLRMVSDGVLSSVILTDSSLNLLNLACWPQSLEGSIKKALPNIYKSLGNDETILHDLHDSHLYSFPIFPDDNMPMYLFVIKDGEQLSSLAQEQITDVIRISVNIWGKGHSIIAIKELIRSILTDDPIKMRRLAELFHVDISDIHEMWILTGFNDSSTSVLTKSIDVICEYMKTCSDIVFADIYDDNLLLFSSTPHSEKDAEEQVSSIISTVTALDATITLSKFSNLQNTTDVRNAYICHTDHLADAKKIFPTYKWFSAGDLEFSQECHNLIDQGEASFSQYTSLISQLTYDGDEYSPVETLSVYMLDANSSITTASELLHIHKNTVKYRLKTIDNLLGYSHDKMPDSIKIYYALGLYRLLK